MGHGSLHGAAQADSGSAAVELARWALRAATAAHVPMRTSQARISSCHAMHCGLGSSTVVDVPQALAEEVAS